MVSKNKVLIALSFLALLLFPGADYQFKVGGANTVTVPNANGTVATLAGTQTLTNKTLTTPTVDGATLSVDDTDSAFVTSLASTSSNSANRVFTLDVNNGNRTLELSGNLIKSGSDPLTLVTTATTSVTLPTTGTLAAVDGALGTPSSVTLTNGTGLPLSTGVTGVLTLASGGTEKNLTAVNGGLVWSDADSLEVTAAGTASQWILSGGAGAPTMSNTTTSPKVIDGTVDSIQLAVQGHSTQTTPIFVVEKSDSTDMLQVSDTGVVVPMSSTITISDTGGSGGNVVHACTRRAGTPTATNGTTASVTCSGGEIVTGGGCSVSTGTGAVGIYESYPSADNTWTCQRLASGGGTMTARAVCCQY